MSKPGRSATIDPPHAYGAGADAPDDETTLLRRLVEGTADSTGDEFFRSLVRNLSLAVESSCALIAEFTERPTRVRTLACWANGDFQTNVEYDVAGTPCEDVIHGATRHWPEGLRRRFPNDPRLADMRIESYVGIPLLDRGGTVLGHLAVLDTRPLPEERRRFSIFKVFAARAAAELERLRAEQMLRASEKRFRDLYEEAPIAYIYEDTGSRFVSANRAAMRLLGLKPGDVPGTLGLSLIAPTPETQERVRQAIAAIQAGQERACIELELRRKDDGRPVWVQWWSKPEPDGKYTRTMLVDITARVVAEQERNRLQAQNLYLQEELKSEYNFEEIVGGAPALQATLTKAKQVAPTDSTVLILGETGTGKELIARAIHNVSKRRDRPLIKVNCSALPTGLIESELFGHEKGAFTGATERRIGRFALADGGTIFLDEIGDVPATVQVRLLRVLQEHEFEPVGSSKTLRVDVRVIAATNRDLEQAVADGTFRADLFYRLNVFPIHVPPLRARQEDVPLLAHYFMERYATKIGRRMDGIAADTMQHLLGYPWPGNIRELENVIERAVILSPQSTLHVDPSVLPLANASTAPSSYSMVGALPTQAGNSPGATAPGGQSAPPTLEESQRRHILRALDECRWVIEGPRGAASVLGLNPSTLRSRMKKLGIASRNP